MTLAEKLNIAIENQRAELGRLQEVVDLELPKAKKKLAALQALSDSMTKPFEAALASLKANGITLDD